MENLMQDIRYALRMLRKSPGFTAVAVIMLAFGVGGTSAVFSVVNSILLRPLPYRNSERLVTVAHSYPKMNLMASISAPAFFDYRDQTTVFESAALFSYTNRNLTGQGEPERLGGLRVSASYFPTLGVEAALGRIFLPEDEQAGHHRVVILSCGLWQRRFGSDPAVLGRTLTLDGESYTVVGVMPTSLYGEIEIWVPIALTPRELALRQWNHLSMIARLKPGVDLQQARAEMNTIADRLRQQYPQLYSRDSWGIAVKSLHEETVGEIRRPLLVLLFAVGFVLLIVCANVANLLLARAARRRRELAVRAALGAGYWRLIRQLLTESVLLAVLGGALGLLLSLWSVELLVAVNRPNIPRWQEIGVDGRVLAFNLAISLLTSVVFGLAPALHSSNIELTTALKEGGRSSVTSLGGFGLRNLLVISEVALALVLLVGAGLLLRSFARLLEVNLGFRPKNLLTMQVSLPDSKYGTPEQRRAFYKQALEQIKALPGVESAGAVSNLPLSGYATSGGFKFEGRVASAEQSPFADLRSVSSEYLQAMRIPLLRGRYFNERDRTGAPDVVIIDEILAQRYFPDEDPIGKRVAVESPQWREIVGVVGPIKYKGLDVDYQGQLYFPHAQDPWRGMYRMNLVVRTAAEPMSFVSAVRGAMQRVDKNQPVYRIMTMEQLVADSISQRRLSMFLLGLFASLAMLLAAVGLYGTLAYSVAEWTHEIGIRMALGAQRENIFKLVVGQAMILTATGVAFGLAAAFALSRLISGLLFGVAPTDPGTFAAVPLLLTAVALMACYVPARRATKVDPMVALRYE
jgi:putative ABC transport system permease protein